MRHELARWEKEIVEAFGSLDLRGMPALVSDEIQTAELRAVIAVNRAQGALSDLAVAYRRFCGHEFAERGPACNSPGRIHNDRDINSESAAAADLEPRGPGPRTATQPSSP